MGMVLIPIIEFSIRFHPDHFLLKDLMGLSGNITKIQPFGTKAQGTINAFHVYPGHPDAGPLLGVKEFRLG